LREKATLMRRPSREHAAVDNPLIARQGDVDVYVDNREPTPCELFSETIACLIMASDGLRLPESTFRLEYVP
jgi:hypothetical protein